MTRAAVRPPTRLPICSFASRFLAGPNRVGILRMVQPGSGSGKVPITIGSVQFSFSEGKQARYMKHRSAASARRAISALFVANGFSVYGRRTFRCSSRTISSAMRCGSSEKPGRGSEPRSLPPPVSAIWDFWLARRWWDLSPGRSACAWPWRWLSWRSGYLLCRAHSDGRDRVAAAIDHLRSCHCF